MNEERFAHFYARLKPLIECVRRFGRSHEDAEDFAHDAMAELWTRGDTIGAGAEWSYTKRVAYSRHVNDIERRPRGEELDEEHEEVPESSISPEDRVILNEFMGQFADAMREIPQTTQQILVRYRDGAKSHDIAAEFKMDPTAVRSRISRAHEFVRERFPNELTEKEAWHAALDVWIAAQREQVREEARVYCPELTPRRLRVLPYIAVIALTAVVAHFVLRPKSEPYVHPAQHELRAGGSRGGHVTRPALDLPAGEERSLIRVVLSGAPHDPAYRIEIADESKTIWTSELVQPDGDRAFALSLPRSFLRAGNYRLLVFGVDDSGSHLREAYSIRMH